MIVSVGRHQDQEVLIIPKPELDETLPVSQINASSLSFAFLEDEPDLYSLDDLEERYI